MCKTGLISCSNNMRNRKLSAMFWVAACLGCFVSWLAVVAQNMLLHMQAIPHLSLCRLLLAVHARQLPHIHQRDLGRLPHTPSCLQRPFSCSPAANVAVKYLQAHKHFQSCRQGGWQLCSVRRAREPCCRGDWQVP